MKRWMKLAAAAVFAIGFMGGFAGAAQADADLSPADKTAMHSYVLSMDKVKGLGDAMSEFKAGQDRPGAQEHEVHRKRLEVACRNGSQDQCQSQDHGRVAQARAFRA
jgi:hypothetical protein